MGMKFNPVSGQFDLVGSGVSIGDTVGGSPANGGVLYADGSDTLQADILSMTESSYFGGTVPFNRLSSQSITTPALEFVDISGFAQPNAVAVTGSTGTFQFGVIDTASLSQKFRVVVDTANSANNTLAFATGGIGTSTAEFEVTATQTTSDNPIDMNSNKITELANGVASTDAANLGQVDAKVSDTAYGAGWDGVTTVAPSKNAVYDKIQALGSGTPGGSSGQIQFNSSGSFAGDSRLLWVDWAWGGGAFGKYLQVGTSSQGQGILMPKVNKESWVAIGPQGNYGNDFAQDEPHVAINTVRLIGNGGGSLSLRTHTNANTVTLFVANMAAASYVTPSNGIKGFYLTENGGNNAATITMGPTDQGFFARKARLQAQCETGLISADATINTIQAKGQTSQTGDLYSGADASANIVFRVDQSGGAVFNENSTSTGDVRMEGDTDANLFFSDASADTVQIGSATTADSAKFYVNGKISTSDELEVNGALNHDGTTVGFYGVTPVARSSAYTPTNVTTDRSYDANATTIDELADVLGSLIVDLQSVGLIG